MSEICPGFVNGFDSVFPRRETAAQAIELWKDEPHPVAGFAATVQFGEGGQEYVLLGRYKTIEVIRVVHGYFFDLNPCGTLELNLLGGAFPTPK